MGEERSVTEDCDRLCSPQVRTATMTDAATRDLPFISIGKWKTEGSDHRWRARHDAPDAFGHASCVAIDRSMHSAPPIRSLPINVVPTVSRLCLSPLCGSERGRIRRVLIQRAGTRPGTLDGRGRTRIPDGSTVHEMTSSGCSALGRSEVIGLSPGTVCLMVRNRCGNVNLAIACIATYVV